MNTLHKTIMRRVYYAYTIRLATHTVTKHIVALAVLGFALAKLVHVAAVYETVARIQVGELVPALARIISSADMLTLAVLALALFTALSLPLRVVIPRFAHAQFA